MPVLVVAGVSAFGLAEAAEQPEKEGKNGDEAKVGHKTEAWERVPAHASNG